MVIESIIIWGKTQTVRKKIWKINRSIIRRNQLYEKMERRIKVIFYIIISIFIKIKFYIEICMEIWWKKEKLLW